MKSVITSSSLLLVLLYCGTTRRDEITVQYQVTKPDAATYLIADSITVLSFVGKPYGKRAHPYSLPVSVNTVGSIDTTICTTDSVHRIVFKKNADCRLVVKGSSGDGVTFTDTVMCHADSNGNHTFVSRYFSQSAK